MKINWKTGIQNWAYRNAVKHLTKELCNSDFEHVFNEKRQESDIDFLVAVDQLKKNDTDKRTILHLDGNRWYENI